MRRPLPEWDPARDDVFVCVAVRPVAPDVATVVLAPQRPSTICFEAGQYVTIEFSLDGRAVPRCYTIASPPTRPERLAITVKRSTDGVVSPWLHGGGLAAGDTVRLGAPQGDFTLERHPAAAYLFLTAGTGVTPALSVLREAYDLGADLGTDVDIVLVHSQRRLADVPYRQEVEWIAATLPRVRLHLLPSEDRRLDAELLARLVPDAGAREVFICGPDGYRAVARDAARSCGVEDERVHEETFTFAPTAPAPRSVPETGRGHRIEFRDHHVSVDCPPGTTVLDAAVQAGLALPFSCTQGLCGTCKSTLVEGEVDMNPAGGIRPREIAAGKVLLCCSTPRSDLVITA